MERRDLSKFKQEYQILKERYNLPSFEDLNRDFGIEKIYETETDFLLREIGRSITEKLSNYMRFVETLLHPVNATMFVFSIIKTLNTEDKKILEELYKKLATIEIKLMELDINYSEEIQANFIKDSFADWQDIKREWTKILESIKKNMNNKSERNNEKGYFG